jgi:hypothetical protein
MDWKALGESLAKLGLPLLGTALAGPAGGAVGAALASHIGGDVAASGSPQDILSAITANAEAGRRAREFEATHQEHLLQITTTAQMEAQKAEAADRQSARAAMIQTSARTPAVLSWVVVVAISIMYGFLIWKGNPANLDDVILGRILGTLDTAFGVVLAFWLGTSFSSRQKDDTIKAMAQ